MVRERLVHRLAYNGDVVAFDGAVGTRSRASLPVQNILNICCHFSRLLELQEIVDKFAIL